MMKKTLFLLTFLMTLVMGAKADSFFDTSSMSAQDQNKPIGWGAGVTGGEDLNQVTVTTLEELTTALTGTDKKTIIVDGTITFTGSVTIDGVQNKSIYGKPGAILQNPTHTNVVANTGILYLKNCSNIIIRNLTFKGAGAYDVDGNDNLTLQNCSNIWVDHCDFQDGVDGNFDCKSGSDNICVSWCRFRYLKEPYPYDGGESGHTNDHRFTNLWGSGDTASGDENHLNTTFVNCWWDEGCKQRMPRVRFGKIHLLNCLYSSSVADYCVGGGYKSNVYIEKCAFTGSGEPWRNFATGKNKEDPSITYYNYNVTFSGNYDVADGAQRMYDTDPYYTPSYAYESYEASSVESVVSNASNGAGATLKLPSQDFNVTWSMANGSSSTAVASIDDVVLTHSWAMSSKIVVNSTATIGGNVLTKFNPTEAHNPRVERNSNYYVEWTFRPFPGYQFTPTSVSFDAVKCGTGDPTIDVDFTDGAGTTQQLATNAAINRDGNAVADGNPAINHSYSITTANHASGNAVTLRIYIGKCNANKQVALGRIVINGKLSGTKDPLEIYTVTYENNDGAAYGTAPAAVDVTQYESTTIPANTTLYKYGYTLTGWNDGTATYAIGADYTPTESVTMHPVFTANVKTLSDIPLDKTVTWYFGKSNGAPDYNGSATAQVKQITIGGSKVDLGVKMAGGSNDGRNDEWMNNQSMNMTLPVVKNAVVKAKVYYTNAATINGENIPYDESYGTTGNVVYTYTYTGEDPAEIAVNVGNQFLSYISVTYPGTGDPWANFESFEMDLTNGSYIHSDETSNTTIGFKKDGENIVRSEAEDDENIGTLTGKFHSNEHGLQNFSMTVAVPGYAKISAGTCAWGGNLTITGTNSFSKTINTNTGACFHQDKAANKVYAYYTTNEGTTLTIAGGSYMPYIAVESVDFYAITGSIDGGDIDGKEVRFTSNLTGQVFAATVASGAFTLNVPADTYAVTLSDNDDYVISDPTSVVVSAAKAVTINIVPATPQTVTGNIVNAPAEAFTLTFTGNSYTESVNCAAGATSFTKNLMPDTYVMSTSVGTLSPLSVASFKVVNAAVSHNIYFPETIPAATSANITVDKTAAVAANVYHSVSDAIAAAKAGSISSPVITLTSGQTYREQVVVDMANVTLKTSGAEKAKLTWYYGIGYSYYSLNASGLYDKDRAMTRNEKLMTVGPWRWGATVLVTKNGKNFKAENIIFENSFNQYYTTEEVEDGVEHNLQGSGITYDRTLTEGEPGYYAADSKAVTERAAAIAFENNPTGCQLYNCEFLSSQDTFYSSGSIYVKNCSIMGNTDYIFGGGNVVFDDCDLVIGGYSDEEASAYITANSAGANEYYIFRDCTVKPSARTYIKSNLGRDWGGVNTHVYFFNLKNEIGNKLEYKWNNMGGGVSAGTADLHIYDFDPTVNANYSTTGSAGANINGLVSDADALNLYAGVVTRLAFTPEHIYDGNLELGESSAYNVCRIAANNLIERDVTLSRSITADKWSTICLPFALTESQITAAFGSGVKVAELASSTDTELTFSTVTAMEANKPYAIKVSSDFAGATINGVTIAKATPEQTVGNWVFNGTFTSLTAPVDSYVFSGNKLRKVTGNNVTVKPFRAYITYNGVAPANELEFILDGETTSVETVYGLPFTVDSYYDLQGRKVVNGQLKKGVYIVNGRKTVVK